MQPLTAAKKEEFRKDGTLAARMGTALELGNHKYSSDLIRRAKYKLRMLDQEDGAFPRDRAMAPPLARQGMPSTGTVKILALLIDFSDYTHTVGSSTVNSMLFQDGAAGNYPYESLRNFYQRSSYNKLEIQGNTLGWIRVGQPRSAIITTTAGREALIKSALDYWASQGHDFSQYDSDNDGYIDYFIVMWTGPDTGWGSFWWGYQTTFVDENYTLNGKRLRKYSWQWEADDPLVTIHETGHALGLPDYYDYNDAEGPGGGLGGLDMMDTNLGDHNAFSKFMLDWLSPENLDASTHTVVLRPSNIYGDSVKLFPAGSPGDPFEEYFMVQNRARAGNDIDLPADGLLIWHVDARLDAGGSDFLYDNSDTDHKLLRLMEADGLEEIELGQTADARDFFVEGHSFNLATQPNSNAYDGSVTGVFVGNIRGESGSRTFECGISTRVLAPVFSGVGISSLAVTWNNIPGASYVAVLASDSEYANIIASAAQSANSLEITGLQAGQRYYFQVKLFSDTDDSYLANRISTVTLLGNWLPASSLSSLWMNNTPILLPNGKVLMSGSWYGGPELYSPGTNSWSAAGGMLTSRWSDSIALLPNGRVLVAGGNSMLDTAEIYDPGADAWSSAGRMSVAAENRTATLLPSGKVLLAGGYDGTARSGAELYDPDSNSWSTTGSMGNGRYRHVAIRLLDGRVLVSGGYNNTNGYLASAEIYDPTTGAWSNIAPMSGKRAYHRMTLLDNGKVLVTGGYDGSPLSSAEIFDPVTGTWSSAGSMSSARRYHTATWLVGGKVLVLGGGENSDVLSSAELYDPGTNKWTVVDPMPGPRNAHSAILLPDGKVLVVGGYNGSSYEYSSELLDTSAGLTALAPVLDQVNYSSIAVSWAAIPGASYTVALSSDANFMHFISSGIQSANTAVFAGLSALTKYYFEVRLSTEADWGYVENRISTMTSTPVLLAWTGEDDYVTGGVAPGIGKSTTAFVYRVKYINTGGTAPGTGYPKLHIKNKGSEISGSPFGMTYVSGSYLTGAIYMSSNVLGAGNEFSYYIEAFDGDGYPASGLPTISADAPVAYDGIWSDAANMSVERYAPSLVQLQDGKVMVYGGCDNYHGCYSSAELYAPALNTWSSAGNMSIGRNRDAAILLPNGKVLVAGGANGGAISSAELYDPESNTWSSAASMLTPRYSHTATLLRNGKVLVVGGMNGSALSTAELYDSKSNTWSPGGTLGNARWWHTATLLPSGKVLVVGGTVMGTGSAELYDPDSNSWSFVGTMSTSRFAHVATLLPDGRVLVAGGIDASDLSSAELYDPDTGLWSNAASMPMTLGSLTAELLPNGEVLVSGGAYSGGGYSHFPYAYYPASNTWKVAGSTSILRNFAPSTMLSNGKVLFPGGYDGDNYLSSVSLFKPYDMSLTSVGPVVSQITVSSASITWMGAVSVDYSVAFSSDATFMHLISSGIQSSVSAALSGLVPATRYFFEVKYSTEPELAYVKNRVSVVTLASEPGPPQGNAFSDVRPDSMTVRWSSGTDAAGYNPQGTLYGLELSTASDFTPVSISSQPGTYQTLVAGLVPNTTYYVRVRALNPAGIGSGSLELGAVLTPAAQPGVQSGSIFTQVYTSSLTVIWSSGSAAGFNPPGTMYQVELSTVGEFNQLISSMQTTDLDVSFIELVPNTSYYARVRAVDYGGSATAFTLLGSSRTYAVVPGLPEGEVYAGVSSVSLAISWSSGSVESGYNPPTTLYRVELSTSLGFEQITASSETYSPWASFTSLSPNTTYYPRLSAFGGYDRTEYLIVPATATDPTPPTNNSVPVMGLSGSGFTYQWESGGNSSGTVYKAYVSTTPDFSGWAYAEVSTTDTITAFDGLSGNATYYAHVCAMGYNGAVTGFSSVVSTTTLPQEPVAGNFGAVSASAITAHWSPGDSELEGLAFFVELSSSSGFSNIAASSYTANTFAAFGSSGQGDDLVPNTTYYMRVRAYGRAGNGLPADLGGVATLASPPNNSGILDVWRSSAAVAWDNNGNPPGTLYRVEFWEAGASTTSLTVDVASAVITGLLQESTAYVRVMAVNRAGIATGYDLEVSTFIPATMAPLPRGESETLVYNQVSMTVTPETFSEDVSVSMRMPDSVPPDNDGLISPANKVVVDISALDSGMRKLQPHKDIDIAIDYSGVALGGADEGTLVIATYNEDRSVWVPLYTTRDVVGKTVTAKVGHFSLFQLMYSIAGTGISGVTVGPNPLKPSSNPGQSFTFRNLPADGRVKMYSYMGELLYEASADGAGMAVWDGRNKSGARVASGLYLALVQGAGDKKIMKLVIER